MHAAALEYVAGQVGELGPFGRVIEIGSRNINGSVRHLFDGADYVGLDLVDGPEVDWVGDALDYKPDELADCVVACEVFEHYDRWPDLVQVAQRWLKPDGVLIVTAAYTGRMPHSAKDGAGLKDGEHYANLTKKALETAIVDADFASYEMQVLEFDIRAVAWA